MNDTRLLSATARQADHTNEWRNDEIRMSNEYVNRQSTIENLTSDLRPLTSTERGRSRGFTLAEMLIVVALIGIMLVALVPAVTSLSKAGARRAARDSLLGGIEQARAEAIKSGQGTYVVFPTFTSGAQSTLDRYNYRSYAIFEDNGGNVKQLTDWKSFPVGVALRAAGPAPLSSNSAPTAIPTPSPPTPTFSFTPDTTATAQYQYLKFNSNGELQAPAANVVLGVFEGYVNNNGSEVATTKDGSGNASAVEYVMVSQFTGRAEPAQPAATPTATP